MSFNEWSSSMIREEIDLLRNTRCRFIGTELWWHLLNENSSTIREEIWPFTKCCHSIFFARSPVVIYWMELSTIREGIWSFTEGSHSILLQEVVMTFIECSSSTIREGTWSFTKDSNRFNWFGIVMAFFDENLFHDKRRNLIVDERLPFDLIGT
jgi:hypothetical protein